MLTLVWAAWAVLATAPDQSPLSLAETLSRARPAAEELALAAELAAVRREIAETSHRLASGPVLEGSAGPRGTDGSTRADAGVELELPLLAQPARRAELATALSEAVTVLLAEAAAGRREAVTEAYIEAWLAESRLAGQQADLAALERWRSAISHRVEEGAEARFELDLVEIEAEAARAVLAAAESERLRAWGELAARSEVPAEPVPLADPLDPHLPAAESLRKRFAGGLLRSAVEARRRLAEHRERFGLARAQSRWSLRSSAAREGEESVARLGLAWRLPLAGEKAAAAEEVERRLAAARREAELDLAALESRFAAALSLFGGTGPAAVDTSRALGALEARLVEGKARPSEVLVQRRSLLAVELSRLDRRAAWLRAAYELEALTLEMTP